MKQALILSLCAAIFLAMLGIGLSLKHLSDPITLEEPVTLEVRYGDSIHSVARKMQEQGLIQYPQLLTVYARLFDMANKIKAGEYQVKSGDFPLLVLDNIVKGKVLQYAVTMIDGSTAKEAIQALHKAKGIVKTIEPNQHAAILKAVGADPKYQHIEGLFYPDTYHYSTGMKDTDILKVAYQKMQDVLATAWAANEKELPYKSAYEVLIMASIIERETSVGAEREQIAGVFVERLLKGMKLQTDPTVIYGMGDKYKGNIRRKDLLNPTPYNTYTIKGLPPTPIALPNQASIVAALNPLLNGNIYFVAKGDGYHKFSKTLAEHNQAVREFQLKRKTNYRSTPK